MTEKFAVELGNVQRTMFLPLWGRAYESKKEKPLLVDKTALAIIEAVDFDFSTIAKNISRLSQVAWIMRSLCVDDAVRAFLATCPGATVVNIGCGMDTTFDRVDDGALLWYDLDLPDVIRLRRQFIPETERRRAITASFLDEGWLREIRVVRNVLFIAAGVFYYFNEKDIRGFLVRLADRFPGSEIVFDVSSPYGVKVANRMVIQNSGLDERSFLIWGLKDPNTILSWDPRFRLVSVDYYFGARGRSLDLGTRLFGMLSDLLKIQYMLHLKMLD